MTRQSVTRETVEQRALGPVARGAPLERLRRKHDFDVALRHGKRARRGEVAVAVRWNGTPAHRIGYSVGRRVGGAVVRNRVRRRLREIVRELLGARPGSSAVARVAAAEGRVRGENPAGPAEPGRGADIVVTAFAGAAALDFWSLRADLAEALRRAGLIEGSKAEAARADAIARRKHPSSRASDETGEGSRA